MAHPRRRGLLKKWMYIWCFMEILSGGLSRGYIG
jgi:hypothetical protein